MITIGEPLKIHELNIDGLVEELVRRGVKLQSSKIGKLTPKQSLIVNDHGRFKVVACGRRFGKTLLCVLMALAVALQEGRKIWIVAKSYELTDRVFLELYHIIVNELKIAQHKSRLNRYIRLKNGSEIRGKSCENRNTLVGDAVDLIIWDETALEDNSKEIWEQELYPCLTDRSGSAVFISTPRGQNNFYSWYKTGKYGKDLRDKITAGYQATPDESIQARWSSFKFSSYANTIEEGGYLRREEIDAARLQLPAVRFAQEYMADFNAVADRVFPEFNLETQVVDWEFNGKPYNPAVPDICIGMDFNYTTPCTTLYAQIDHNMNVFIFDEYHPTEAHVNIHQQAKQLIDSDTKYGKRITVVVADVAGKQKDLAGRSAWDDLNTWGIHPVGRKQKIETGCDLIRLWSCYPELDKHGHAQFNEDGSVKSYPKIFVHKRCVSLIFALENARAGESRNGVPKEGYLKDGRVDGPLDALRYLLVYLLHDSGYVGLIPTK